MHDFEVIFLGIAADVVSLADAAAVRYARTISATSCLKEMRRRSIAPMFADVTPEVLATLKGYADAGQLKSVIDRTWPLEKTSDALACLEGYHARGKVVVTLAGTAASPPG